MAAGRENGRVRRKKRENLNNRMALIGVTLVVFSLAIAVHLKGLDLEQKDLNYRLREESLMKQVEVLEKIAALMLEEYRAGMEAKGIAYSYTPEALKALVAQCQGGKFGARDLRRIIRKQVEDPAASRIIDGELAMGGSLTVDAEAGSVVLRT